MKQHHKQCSSAIEVCEVTCQYCPIKRNQEVHINAQSLQQIYTVFGIDIHTDALTDAYDVEKDGKMF